MVVFPIVTDEETVSLALLATIEDRLIQVLELDVWVTVSRFFRHESRPSPL
jgi:hypothetical protein